MEEPSFRNFEPVFRIEGRSDQPSSGLGTFRTVPYVFAISGHQPKGWAALGALYDLTPVDLASGLPMLAAGIFRQPDTSNDDRVCEVYWTSFGSPGLGADPDVRRRFLNFLDAFAAGEATAAHRDAFLVAHYLDPIVEALRRDCVRIIIHIGSAPPAADQAQQLSLLAERLRAAT